MARVCGIPVRVEKMANSANMEVSTTIGGRYRIVNKGNKGRVATVNTLDEVKDVLNRFVGQAARDLDESFIVPIRGKPLSQNPVLAQSQLTPTRRRLSLLQIGFGAKVLTPAREFMQAIERLGRGPAFSKIWQPTQAAKGRFDEALAGTVIPALKNLFEAGDTTFQAAIKKFDGLTKNFTGDERRLMTLHGEYFTKQELAQPGVLLENGLDPLQIGLADEFSRLGMADDMPVLIRRSAIIDDFMRNRQKMVEIEIPKMENAILEGRLPQEFRQELDRILEFAGTETTIDDLYKIMQLSGEEVEAMRLLRTIVDNDAVNIPAIYRYATADNLEAGFKNGRAQFAAQHNMSEEIVQMSLKRMKLIEAAFDGTGLSAQQIVGAQFPVFREFISAGLLPGKQFGAGRGAVTKWANVLGKGLPEGDEILKRRVLSGHLDPHELNPSVSAMRHVRNMLLRKHFDPVMPGALRQMEVISKGQDERVGKIIQNYLHELEGIPTESFKQLTAMVRSMGRFGGFQVDDRIAEKLVASLNFLTYSASIPFRASLIVRNYFQTTLAIPIVGGEAWYAGLKSMLGWDGAGFDPKLHAAAMQRAIKANALKINVIPLHGGSEAVGGGAAESIFGKLTEDFAKVGYNVRELFDIGFSAYRNGDDFGRVIAFEAGRFRVNKHMATWSTSARTNADMAILKENAKVLTFDETVEAAFERMVLDGNEGAAADLIGKSLADKVHFLYGDANHPSGWGSVYGRLFGQFGTFPVQYLNHVTESMTRGTLKDKIEFAGVHTALNLGIITVGAELFDADLTSWAFAPSLTYTGGPYAELGLSLLAAYGGSDAEQSLARRNLQMMLPWWNRPSIFVPGSYFLNDLVRSFDEDDFAQGIGRATGVRFLNDEPSSVEELFTNMRAGFGWVNEMIIP